MAQSRFATGFAHPYDMPDTRPICQVVAGPNGSGKSTFALRYLPRWSGHVEYVNPDLIAQGESPLDIRLTAYEAAKRTLLRIRQLVAIGKSFAFETTLSGKTQFSLLDECIASGFEVNIYYLWLPSPDPLPARIRHRVVSGGHDGPGADIVRRFARSSENLRKYAMTADRVLVFDAQPQVPELIWRRNGSELVVDPVRAAEMKKGLGL